MPNDVSTALFAKFLNRYAHPSMHESLQRFLVKSKSQVALLGIPALGHLCGIMETTLHADEDFLFRVCQRVLSSMPDVRLKDLSKIANLCSFFSYRPEIDGEDFFVALLRAADRSVKLSDVATYPSKLVELLAALAHMGLFSMRLLNFTKSPAFWKNYFGTHKKFSIPNFSMPNFSMPNFSIQFFIPNFSIQFFIQIFSSKFFHPKFSIECQIFFTVSPFFIQYLYPMFFFSYR